MTSGEFQAEDRQGSVIDALRSYVETGEPLEASVLAEFDADRPKDLIRELGENGLSFAEPEARDRYLRLCQFADRKTDYEAFGPARAAGSESGISGRDRSRKTRFDP